MGISRSNFFNLNRKILFTFNRQSLLTRFLKNIFQSTLSTLQPSAASYPSSWPGAWSHSFPRPVGMLSTCHWASQTPELLDWTFIYSLSDKKALLLFLLSYLEYSVLRRSWAQVANHHDQHCPWLSIPPALWHQGPEMYLSLQLSFLSATCLWHLGASWNPLLSLSWKSKMHS